MLWSGDPEEDEVEELNADDSISIIFLRTSMKKSSYQKDKGTGGKACWKGYKRVGANDCVKVKKSKK